MKKLLLGSLCMIALFLSSCVPKTHTTVPSIEGYIIDKNTKEPIEDIVLSKNTYTNKEGHFLFPSETELGINTPMGGLWHISRSFTVRKEGYTSLSCTCDVLNNSTGCIDVVIPLTKKEVPSLAQMNSIESNMLRCIPLLPQYNTNKPQEK